MLLGFRTLRANRHFRLAYYASMLRCAIQLAALFLGGTVIRSEAADLVLTVLSAVFVLGVTLELYMGIMDAQAAAGLELRAPAAGWLMVWYILLYALGLLTAAGSIVGLLMLAAFIVILVSLVKLSKQLDEAGYAVEAAPVRLTDRRLGALLALAAAAAVALGLAFFSRYDMDWQPQPERGGEAAGVAEELLALGFPENVLADLADSDVLLCEGATQVLSGTDTLSFRDGSELLTTGVAVLLPEFDGWEDYWLIFHHFEWQEGARLPGTDSAELWATSGWMLDRKNPAHGLLLYSEDGVTYTAPPAEHVQCAGPPVHRRLRLLLPARRRGGAGLSVLRPHRLLGRLCPPQLVAQLPAPDQRAPVSGEHLAGDSERRVPRLRPHRAQLRQRLSAGAERALPELRRGRRGARQLKNRRAFSRPAAFFT